MRVKLRGRIPKPLAFIVLALITLAAPVVIASLVSHWAILGITEMLILLAACVVAAFGVWHLYYGRRARV
jgi:hypothetical protein